MLLQELQLQSYAQDKKLYFKNVQVLWFSCRTTSHRNVGPSVNLNVSLINIFSCVFTLLSNIKIQLLLKNNLYITSGHISATFWIWIYFLGKTVSPSTTNRLLIFITYPPFSPYCHLECLGLFFHIPVKTFALVNLYILSGHLSATFSIWINSLYKNCEPINNKQLPLLRRLLFIT